MLNFSVRMFPLIVVLVLFSGAAVHARPIEVVVGRGRNLTAIKLVDQGQAEFHKGNLATARHTLDTAIQSDPTYWPALFVRAQVFIRLHQYDMAIQDCERILHQDSTVAEAALLRAMANHHLGRDAVSLKEINHVISIRPRQDAFARAYDARAILHLHSNDPSLKNPQLAVADATLACKLMAWSDGEMIDTLATACAAVGDFESASRYEQQALGVKAITNEERRSYQEHLALFKQRRPIPTVAR